MPPVKFRLTFSLHDVCDSLFDFLHFYISNYKNNFLKRYSSKCGEARTPRTRGVERVSVVRRSLTSCDGRIIIKIEKLNESCDRIQLLLLNNFKVLYSEMMMFMSLNSINYLKNEHHHFRYL